MPSVAHEMYCRPLHMPHLFPFKEKGQWRVPQLRPHPKEIPGLKKKKKVKPEIKKISKKITWPFYKSVFLTYA